jgi:hypothetical protein
MIPAIRKAYNANFSQAQYDALINQIEQKYGHRPPFAIAETPVFIPKYLKEKLFEACEDITDIIIRPEFLEQSQEALLAGQVVPNETPHTVFLQMDFGICRDENGEFTPQLIEIQGFPSLYFYQYELARGYRQFFDIPPGFNHLFNGITEAEYLEKLRHIIIGDAKPENVILLEVEPFKQATQIDFIIAKKLLGIEVLCVTDLKVENRKVYYEKDGKRIRVHRIFNRVIFDELIKRDDLKREFYFIEDHEVEWVGHPNWFFRISKHTLPFLKKSQYVPNSYFLNNLTTLPEDLENYVLKPLYSFAGSGVIINLNKYDLERIKDPENYILQRKVYYEPVVETLDVNAKCEVRMLMLWEPGKERPEIVNNLVRLSKGEMVGVRYNKGKTWVGGSIGFFET